MLCSGQDAPDGVSLQVVSAKGDDKAICLRCYYCHRGSMRKLKLRQMLTLLKKNPALRAKSLAFYLLDSFRAGWPCWFDPSNGFAELDLEVARPRGFTSFCWVFELIRISSFQGSDDAASSMSVPPQTTPVRVPGMKWLTWNTTLRNVNPSTLTSTRPGLTWVTSCRIRGFRDSN